MVPCSLVDSNPENGSNRFCRNFSRRHVQEGRRQVRQFECFISQIAWAECTSNSIEICRSVCIQTENHVQNFILFLDEPVLHAIRTSACLLPDTTRRTKYDCVTQGVDFTPLRILIDWSFSRL
jgi:hypothetical protein